MHLPCTFAWLSRGDYLVCCRVAWNQDVQHLCGLDGLGEVCVELILPKTVSLRKSILRLGIVYTVVRHRNAPIESIIHKVVSVTRKILNVYFLVFIQEFGKLVSFRYNLPEPSVCFLDLARAGMMCVKQSGSHRRMEGRLANQ